MWVTAWILVASASLYQPQTPPFRTKEECERAREVYLVSRNDKAGACIQVSILYKEGSK